MKRWPRAALGSIMLEALSQMIIENILFFLFFRKLEKKQLSKQQYCKHLFDGLEWILTQTAIPSLMSCVKEIFFFWQHNLSIIWIDLLPGLGLNNCKTIIHIKAN